jgi:hypothetical protein
MLAPGDQLRNASIDLRSGPVNGSTPVFRAEFVFGM